MHSKRRLFSIYRSYGLHKEGVLWLAALASAMFVVKASRIPGVCGSIFERTPERSPSRVRFVITDPRNCSTCEGTSWSSTLKRIEHLSNNNSGTECPRHLTANRLVPDSHLLEQHWANKCVPSNRFVNWIVFNYDDNDKNKNSFGNICLCILTGIVYQTLGWTKL